MTYNFSNVTPHFIAIDLEMNQPSRKIIQIGAAIGNIQTGEIISDFGVYVNPNEPISERIVTLTGITDKHVKNAYTLPEAFEKLTAYRNTMNVFINPLTWGGDDMAYLRNQLSVEDNLPEWKFGRRYIDVKTLYVLHRLKNGEFPAGGLAKSMTKIGLNFKGRKHNATDDSVNTLRMFFKLMEKMD